LEEVMASGSLQFRYDYRKSFHWGVSTPPRAGVLVGRPAAGGGRVPHSPLVAGTGGVLKDGSRSSPEHGGGRDTAFPLPSVRKTKKKRYRD